MPTSPILLCAQNVGTGGWGHFFRMLHLQSALEQTWSIKLGKNSQRRPVPAIYLGVITQETLAIIQTKYTLTPHEINQLRLFPTIAARTKWILTQLPAIIIWDVREHGLGILKYRITSKYKLFHLVLDSRHSLAATYADYTIQALPAKLDSSTSPPNTPPQQAISANLLVDWHHFLGQTAPPLAPTVPLAKRKLQLQQHLAAASQQEQETDCIQKVIRLQASGAPYYVVYIGGIKNKNYLSQLNREILAVWLFFVLAEIDKIDHANENLTRLTNSLTIVLQNQPRIIFIAATPSWVQTAWQATLLTLTQKASMWHFMHWGVFHNHFASENNKNSMRRGKTVAKLQTELDIFTQNFQKKLQNQLQQETHFLPLLPAQQYQTLLHSAQFLWTHPGLSAEQALQYNTPLCITAPTPTLAHIAQTTFLPFYQAPAKLWEQAYRNIRLLTQQYQANRTHPPNLWLRRTWRQHRRLFLTAMKGRLRRIEVHTAKYHKQKVRLAKKSLARRTQPQHNIIVLLTELYAKLGTAHTAPAPLQCPQCHYSDKGTDIVRATHPRIRYKKFKIVARDPVANTHQCPKCSHQWKVRLNFV